MQNLHIQVSVLITVTIILISTQIFGKLFVLIKQPKVVGEMLGGMLLGPTGLEHRLKRNIKIAYVEYWKDDLYTVQYAVLFSTDLSWS